MIESSNLVAEFMLLAGQICAMWCCERNVPILYRGIVPNPNVSQESELYRKEVLEVINEADDDYVRMWWKYKSLLGVVHCQATPLKHSILGLPMYCKVTSPLRRYSDFFVHWQIEAAIRHECESGDSLIGKGQELFQDTKILPFSHREVGEAAQLIHLKERQIVINSRRAELHWIRLALYRAFYFQEATLPALFNVFVELVAGK